MAHPRHKTPGQRATAFEARPAEAVPVLQEVAGPGEPAWRPAAQFSLVVWLLGFFVLATFALYDLVHALLFR